MKKAIIFLLLISPLSCLAANSGLITSLGAASATMESHQDIFQLEIAGGFNKGSCNSTFAAIRKVDTHLISLAMMAYTTKTPVTVWLDDEDIYYTHDNRCVISLIYTN